VVANLHFQSIDGLSEELLLQFRTKLILNLARLCQRQETRYLKVPDRKKGQLTAVEEYELGDSTAGLGNAEPMRSLIRNLARERDLFRRQTKMVRICNGLKAKIRCSVRSKVNALRLDWGRPLSHDFH